MKYGIIIYPSQHIQDEVNSLRKRYDPEYALIKPHITLKTRFDADSEFIEKLTSEIENITEKMKPFKINIRKVSSFRPVSNKIYFKIEESKALSDLHAQLYEGILPNEKFTTFVPHITIAQDLKSDEFVDVYTSLSMRNYNYTDTIDSIQIGYKSEDDQWHIYKNFDFGG